jgi:hypothetical protein
MKRVYELDVYKLAEALSDTVWHDIQEVHLKKPNHDCENSSEEKFGLIIVSAIWHRDT